LRPAQEDAAAYAEHVRASPAHQAAAAAAGAAHLMAANLGDGAADGVRASHAGLPASRARAAVVSSAPAEGTTPPVRERR
jgi:hypothetical protein